MEGNDTDQLRIKLIINLWQYSTLMNIAFGIFQKSDNEVATS